MSAFDAFLMDCVNDCIEGGTVSDPWPEEPPADWPRDEYDPDLPYTWPDDERQRWEINNDAVAEWALKKYARAEQEIQRIRELAAEEIARINQRVEEVVSSQMHDIDFFGHHLTHYHSRLIQAGKAGKTYKLLSGDLTSRDLPGRVEVKETPEVLAILQRRGMAREKVVPDKAAIKAWLKSHPRSSIPGVEFITGEESFAPKPRKHEQPEWLPMPRDAEEAA